MIMWKAAGVCVRERERGVCEYVGGCKCVCVRERETEVYVIMWNYATQPYRQVGQCPIKNSCP